jgi:SUF system NifU family Fe-S assembly protein
VSDPALESLYREVILDHYKNPRGHGIIDGADAEAEGQNPLCGDEVSIYVTFGEDGETIDDVKFSGRGCAISQAATSMLMEMTKGRTAQQVAELGHPTNDQCPGDPPAARRSGVIRELWPRRRSYRPPIEVGPRCAYPVFVEVVGLLVFAGLFGVPCLADRIPLGQGRWCLVGLRD